MSLGAIDFAPYPSRLAPPHVFSAGDDFEVCWVHAVSDPAEVVKDVRPPAGRDASRQFPREGVSKRVSTLQRRIKPPVPLRVETASPEPTAPGAIEVDALPEATRGGFFHHGLTLRGLRSHVITCYQRDYQGREKCHTDSSDAPEDHPTANPTRTGSETPPRSPGSRHMPRR